MSEITRRIMKSIQKRFWINIVIIIVIFAIPALLHLQGITVDLPFGSKRGWGIFLLLGSVIFGVGIPILLRTSFQSQFAKNRKTDEYSFLQHHMRLISYSLGASFFGIAAYLFLVPKGLLYIAVFAALYGIYGALPSESKIRNEARFYQLEKE